MDTRLLMMQLAYLLSAVLFTDIVDSTAEQKRRGDSAWKDALAAHHGDSLRLVEQLLEFRAGLGELLFAKRVPGGLRPFDAPLDGPLDGAEEFSPFMSLPAAAGVACA